MAEQGALTTRGTVYPWRCDHMGHMNVMWYVGKFDLRWEGDARFRRAVLWLGGA
jgi:acyl-CoA thioester hydrolase